MRRLLAALAAVLSLGWHAGPEVDQEAWLVEAINHERTARGAPALEHHESMHLAAKAHAADMAARNELEHSNHIEEGAPGDWCAVGENVGVGVYVRQVHHRFMESPAHAGNEVNPRWDFVGVGVEWDERGKLYVAVRFADVCR